EFGCARRVLPPGPERRGIVGGRRTDRQLRVCLRVDKGLPFLAPVSCPARNFQAVDVEITQNYWNTVGDCAEVFGTGYHGYGFAHETKELATIFRPDAFVVGAELGGNSVERSFLSVGKALEA